MNEDDLIKIRDCMHPSPCSELKRIGIEKNNDHDLLIELKTILKTIQDSFDKERAETRDKFSFYLNEIKNVDSRISAAFNKIDAHSKRIDGLMLGGVVSIISTAVACTGLLIMRKG